VKGAFLKILTEKTKNDMLDGGVQTTKNVNLIPVDYLEKIGEKDTRPYEASSFCQYARELYLEYGDRNIDERRQLVESGRQMSNLRSGKLMLKRDPVHGSLALIKNLPTTTRSDRHVHPLAQTNSTQLTSIWTLSRPRTVPRHFGNTNQAQIQASLIEKLIEHYDEECMDEWFHQQESLSAMDYGTIVIDVCYDHKLNSLHQLRPVLQEADEQVFPGYGYCPECSFEGTPQHFQLKGEVMPRCPQCGTYNVSDMIGPETATVQKIIGVEEYSQGDIDIVLESIPSLNWDFRKLIQHSPFVHKRTEVSVQYVYALLGIEVASSDPDDDDGLKVINAVGTRGGSVPGWGRENTEGNYEFRGQTTVMDEMWFTPEVYAGTTFSKDEKTLSGVVIPANTPLEQIFTEGLYLVAFDEMSVIVGAFNEKCRKKSSVYHIQSHSGIGKGTTDAIEISEHLSIAHSAALAIVKRYAAGGGHWYDSDVLTEKQAQGLLSVGGLVGVKMRGTQYTSIDQALKRVETGKLDQSNLAIIAQLSNMLNICFQTTDFTSGVADQRVSVDTLGGQQLLQAQNQQRSAAPLRMKSYLRTQIFPEVIELYHDHQEIPRFYGTNDKYGLAKGRFIGGQDIPRRVKCKSIPDSELPTDKLTKRDNSERMMEKAQYFGVPFAQLVMASPRVAAWWAEKFDSDLPLFNYVDILVICQERIDAIKKAAVEQEFAAELSGYYEDPKMIGELLVDQLAREITPVEENQEVKAQVISEYLDDDEVEGWTPYTKAGIQALVWRHYKMSAMFKGQLMQMEQEVNLQLQAQAAEAANAITAPQRQEEQDNAMQQEAMSRVGDLMSSQADHDRSEESADNQHARNEAAADSQNTRDELRARSDHGRNLEVEKEKSKQARNQPAKKKGAK
jgi:hypothetical protein